MNYEDAIGVLYDQDAPFAANLAIQSHVNSLLADITKQRDAMRRMEKKLAEFIGRPKHKTVARLQGEANDARAERNAFRRKLHRRSIARWLHALLAWLWSGQTHCGLTGARYIPVIRGHRAHHTKAVAPGVLIDYTRKGKIVGVELLEDMR